MTAKFFIIASNRQLWRLLAMMLVVMSLLYSPAILASNGMFKLHFATPKNEIYQDIAVVYKSSGQFQSIVEGLNKEFILPENIKIQFADKDGPLYDPNTKTVTMSYGFIFYLSAVYLEKYPKADDESLMRFSIGSSTFLLYHEIAHALIDVFQLPVVSNEETAADNLAVILALEYTNDGYNIVMDTAELFDILDQTTTTYEEDDLWDEHALDAQRFYNIICLAYGRYPAKVTAELKELKNEKLLKFIDERGDFCTNEYERQLQAWLKLLDPHLASE